MKIFRFDIFNGTIKKVIPTLSIDHQIRLFDTLTLQGVIYHQGSNANSGHYTSAVKVNNKWFFINDSNVSDQGRFLDTVDDSYTPYILVYKKINDMSTSEEMNRLIFVKRKKYTNSLSCRESQGKAATK